MWLALGGRSRPLRERLVRNIPLCRYAVVLSRSRQERHGSAGTTARLVWVHCHRFVRQIMFGGEIHFVVDATNRLFSWDPGRHRSPDREPAKPAGHLVYVVHGFVVRKYLPAARSMVAVEQTPYEHVSVRRRNPPCMHTGPPRRGPFVSHHRRSRSARSMYRCKGTPGGSLSGIGHVAYPRGPPTKSWYMSRCPTMAAATCCIRFTVSRSRMLCRPANSATYRWRCLYDIRW